MDWQRPAWLGTAGQGKDLQASVAQVDSAPDYESGGCRFESGQGYARPGETRHGMVWLGLADLG